MYDEIRQIGARTIPSRKVVAESVPDILPTSAQLHTSAFDTRYDRGAHHFFSQYYPSIWELKTSLRQNTDLDKNKTGTIVDEQSHGVGISNENHAKTWPVSDDFGLRRPAIQKTFRQKTVCLYRSTCHLVYGILATYTLRCAVWSAHRPTNPLFFVSCNWSAHSPTNLSFFVGCRCCGGQSRWLVTPKGVFSLASSDFLSN